MAIALLFVLGIANFAMHRAVLDSGHPLLRQAPAYLHMLGGRMSLVVEFLMLVSAMLMTADGSTGWAWFYGGYSAVNGLSAWLILSGRV